MEILRALGSLAETPSATQQELCSLLGLGEPASATEYSETFVFELYPFASVYLGHEGKLGGEARDRIAGFWRALDMTPPPEPDHLTVMLAFYTEIYERELRASTRIETDRRRHIRASFLWEHLLSWLPIYLLKMSEAKSLFYRKWGELLSQVLLEEIRAVDHDRALSAHLRQAPPIADPRQGNSKDFLESLLAPVRSGMILLRSDLGRAARELSLASRVGERRFLLETLMSQAPNELLLWLARFSKGTARKYRGLSSSYPDIMNFWIGQAERTHLLLLDLAESSEAPAAIEP